MDDSNWVFRPLAVVKPLPGRSVPRNTSLVVYDTPRPTNTPKKGFLDISFKFPSSPSTFVQPSESSQPIRTEALSRITLLEHQLEALPIGNIKRQVSPEPKIPHKPVTLSKPIPRVIIDYEVYENVDLFHGNTHIDRDKLCVKELERNPSNESLSVSVDLSFAQSTKEDCPYLEMTASRKNLTIVKDLGTEPTYLPMMSPQPSRKSLSAKNLFALNDSFDRCKLDQVDSGSTVKPRPSSLHKLQRSSSALTSKFLGTLRMKRKDKNGEVLEMIPRPKLTVEVIAHEGYVQYYLSGKVSLLRLILNHKSVRGYEDPNKIRLKVEIHLHHLVSIQSIVLHNSDNDVDTYWFKLTLGIPKNDQSAQNRDWTVPTSKTNKIRKTYIFGVHSRSDRNGWLMNILKSVTGVFTDSSLSSITKAGWCYIKTSDSSNWTGAWLLVMMRKLHVYNCQNQSVERIDLRKVSSITEVEQDISIRRLYVDSGSILTINSPPLPTMHFIMATPKDTASWKKTIEEVAYTNDDTLEGQQLTEQNIPVIVEQCINFIYTYGSLSEGIYRKSGSPDKVDRILELFKRNAFTVRLVRNEFTEDDVAEALKKFFRRIPNMFFGNQVSSIISIAKLASADEKVSQYIELLQFLPNVKYNTLKMLLGQLRFLASMEHRNRMDILDLARIWDKILLVDFRYNLAHDNDGPLPKETIVMIDLMQHYETLFEITSKELENERQMIKALEQYHTAEKGLRRSFDNDKSVHVWITIEPGYENNQVKVTVTATMTAADVCKEVASQTENIWHHLTLYEVIDDGHLSRPIHYAEIILDITERWSSWETEDRKNNCLKVGPVKTLKNVYRYIQKTSILTPSAVLCYADRRTKGLKKYKLELVDQQLSVFKIIDIERDQYEEVARIDLVEKYVFVGWEAKREQSKLRWALTLVDRDFSKRTKDSPFIGQLLGGLDYNDLIMWHASILQSIYKDDVLPIRDLFLWNKNDSDKVTNDL